MSNAVRLLALATAVVPSLALGAERPPLERYVAGDAAIVFSFRDLPGVWQRMQGLSFVKAAKDPAFKPFIDSLRKELTGAMESTGSVGGLEYDKLAEILRGQALIAVRMPAGPAGKIKPELQVLADVEGKEEHVRLILDRAVNKAVQEGKASKRVVGEVTILTPTKSGDAEKDRFCYALKAGLLIGADTPEVCAKVVQSLPGGPANALSQNALLTRFRRAFAKQSMGLGDVEMYILDVKAIAEAGRNNVETPPPLPASQSVEAMGLSVCAARGEFETLAQMMIVPRAEIRLGNENTMPGRSLPTDAWAPDNAAAYLTFNLDVDKVYEQVVKQFETTSPGSFRQMEEQLREFPDRANPLVTSIKNDVVQPLGDRISVALDRGEFQGRNQLRLLFAWKLRDSDRLSRLAGGLIGLLRQAVPGVTEKDVNGFKVYAFPSVPPPGAIPGRKGAKSVEPPIWVGNAAAAVTRSHLLLTTHVEMIDRTINFHGQPGLAEHPAAAKVLSKAPEAPSAVFYVKAEEFGRLLYSAVANEALRKQASSVASGLPKVKDAVPNLATSIKGDKLPPFDEVKKYFVAPAGGFVILEEGAIRASVYSVK